MWYVYRDIVDVDSKGVLYPRIVLRKKNLGEWYAFYDMRIAGANVLVCLRKELNDIEYVTTISDMILKYLLEHRSQAYSFILGRLV